MPFSRVDRLANVGAVPGQGEQGRGRQSRSRLSGGGNSSSSSSSDDEDDQRKAPSERTRSPLVDRRTAGLPCVASLIRFGSLTAAQLVRGVERARVDRFGSSLAAGRGEPSRRPRSQAAAPLDAGERATRRGCSLGERPERILYARIASRARVGQAERLKKKLAAHVRQVNSSRRSTLENPSPVRGGMPQHRR